MARLRSMAAKMQAAASHNESMLHDREERWVVAGALQSLQQGDSEKAVRSKLAFVSVVHAPPAFVTCCCSQMKLLTKRLAHLDRREADRKRTEEEAAPATPAAAETADAPDAASPDRVSVLPSALLPSAAGVLSRGVGQLAGWLVATPEEQSEYWQTIAPQLHCTASASCLGPGEAELATAELRAHLEQMGYFVSVHAELGCLSLDCLWQISDPVSAMLPATGNLFTGKC